MHDVEPICLSVLRLMHDCRVVEDIPTVHNFCSPGDCSLVRSGYLKGSLYWLTNLRLNNHRVFSFSSLLRIVGGIPHLEHADLLRITWTRSSLSRFTASNCRAGFCHLRSIRLRDCEDNLSLPAFVFAAASTHHTYTRRPTGELAIPPETSAIIELTRTVFRTDKVTVSYFQVMEATNGWSVPNLPSSRSDSKDV